MGPESLAARIGCSIPEARHLLRLHKETYHIFWSWSDRLLDATMISSFCATVFDWRAHVPPQSNVRSLSNFPMQANGAELLRLACIKLITESGIKVCATVHDAILIEDKTENISATVRRAQQIMEDASAIILNGFRLRSDVKFTYYPDRYSEDEGVEMWDKIMKCLAEFEEQPVHQRTQPDL